MPKDIKELAESVDRNIENIKTTQSEQVNNINTKNLQQDKLIQTLEEESEAQDAEIKDINNAINTRIKNKSRNLINSISATSMAFEEVFPDSNMVFFEIGKHLLQIV